MRDFFKIYLKSMVKYTEEGNEEEVEKYQDYAIRLTYSFWPATLFLPTQAKICQSLLPPVIRRP
jgi:hypothetical protein